MNPFEVETRDKLEVLINQVEELETEVKEKKKLEDMLKKVKQSLVDEIEKRNLLQFTWTTPNETKLTYVSAVEPKEEVEHKFCEGLFKQDHPDLYEEYCRDLIDVKSGRKSYVRVTLPKE